MAQRLQHKTKTLANIYDLAFIAAASGPILELWDDSTCPFRSYFGAISGTILEVDDKPIWSGPVRILDTANTARGNI